MRTLIILILLTVWTTKSYGQATDSIAKKLNQELQQIYSQNHINGFAVAIVNQDEVLFTKGYGYADTHKKKKYTENTIQNIGSISKTFIGIGLLKAQELGKLRLDDPINNYLPFEVVNPNFPNTPITIRHLATHTSSIKDPSKYEKNGYVLKEKNNTGAKTHNNFRPSNEMMSYNVFLEKILSSKGEWHKKSVFLKKEPGAKFEYTNIGAGLAALVLENAVKEPFSQFTKRTIFTPLEMINSGWSFDEIDFSTHSKLYANKETELAFYQLVNYPDGGLITSSKELGTYLVELIAGYNGNGKILNKKSYTELYTPKLTDQNHTDRNESMYNDEYNMGVFMGMSKKGQMGHTGGDPGIATHMFFNTKTNIGKILIVNTELSKEGINEFIAIWKKLKAYENNL